MKKWLFSVLLVVVLCFLLGLFYPYTPKMFTEGVPTLDDEIEAYREYVRNEEEGDGHAYSAVEERRLLLEVAFRAAGDDPASMRRVIAALRQPQERSDETEFRSCEGFDVFPQALSEATLSEALAVLRQWSIQTALLKEGDALCKNIELNRLHIQVSLFTQEAEGFSQVGQLWILTKPPHKVHKALDATLLMYADGYGALPAPTFEDVHSLYLLKTTPRLEEPGHHEYILTNLMAQLASDDNFAHQLALYQAVSGDYREDYDHSCFRSRESRGLSQARQCRQLAMALPQLARTLEQFIQALQVADDVNLDLDSDFVRRCLEAAKSENDLMRIAAAAPRGKSGGLRHQALVRILESANLDVLISIHKDSLIWQRYEGFSEALYAKMAAFTGDRAQWQNLFGGTSYGDEFQKLALSKLANL